MLPASSYPKGNSPEEAVNPVQSRVGRLSHGVNSLILSALTGGLRRLYCPYPSHSTDLETREIKDPTWSFCHVERTLKIEERNKHFQDREVLKTHTFVSNKKVDFLYPRKSQ